MRELGVLFLGLAVVTGVGSCRCNDGGPSASATASPPASASASAKPKRLRPLQAESWRVEIPVDGFGPASVSVPLGATRPRPVLVALHGLGDRPEWQCGTWRGITHAYPFVLCPRGVPMPGQKTFTFGSRDQTVAELRAGLRALKQRFGDHVAPGSVVFAGYSLGAIQGVSIVKQEPSFFSRVVLVEGGYAEWSSGVATLFAKGGGQRVMFVCTQPACAKQAEVRAAWTERAGAEAKLVDAGNLGHVFDGRVARVVKRELGWLVTDDPRWKGYQR